MGIFLLVSFLVVVMILVIAGAAYQNRPRITKQDISALDFTKVHEQLRSRKNWEDARITAADAEYRKFLWLLARYPGEMMVPWSQDMDEFWHQHILNTVNYTAMCKKLFGKYIDHTPEDTGNAAAQHRARHKTSERYQREFDKGRSTTTTQNSGCSSSVFASCSAYDSGGSDSHSGGHSCASHGCAADGCGSSCGGGCGGD